MGFEETEWFESRPACIQELIREIPPGEYVMIGTGQHVHVYSYSEDGTVTVVVDVAKTLKEGGRVLLPEDYSVFGVSPKSLVNINEWQI